MGYQSHSVFGGDPNANTSKSLNVQNPTAHMHILDSLHANTIRESGHGHCTNCLVRRLTTRQDNHLTLLQRWHRTLIRSCPCKPEMPVSATHRPARSETMRHRQPADRARVLVANHEFCIWQHPGLALFATMCEGFRALPAHRKS